MLKKRVQKEDGRYLIYYSFPDGPPGDSPGSKKDVSTFVRGRETLAQHDEALAQRAAQRTADAAGKPETGGDV